MYALKIGWKTYLFANAVNGAKVAAKVADLLDKAIAVDTLYNGTDHKVMYHRTEPNIEISLVSMAVTDIYPDHDTLQAYINERLEILAQREREQEALDRLAAPKVVLGADAFDGQ